jgi:murein DD-endopeptidase MepM/ murein hydrolase activator NlpD
MIHKPISNPLITQHFGERPEYYKKYGMAGHNGLDLVDKKAPSKSGAPVFAVEPGFLHVQTYRTWYGKTYGYGLALALDVGGYNDGGFRRWIYAHLQNRKLSWNNKWVDAGWKIAEIDNSGDSTGPHLHIAYRDYDRTGKILNYNNGYFGWKNPLPLLKNVLKDS